MCRPITKSNEVLLALLSDAGTKDGSERKNLFQFLNKIGARPLSFQLGRILEIAESSETKDEYEKKITERFCAN